MITDAAALAHAAGEVVRLGTTEAEHEDAVVVAAFGDPGVARLRGLLTVPVIGIGEAAVREAARGGRRFGIATTTPGLVRSIEANARLFGLKGIFTGVRVPDDDPERLAADPGLQLALLIEAVSACLDADGAEVVIVGGGPLSGAAAQMSQQFGNRIIAPIAAAMRCLVESLSPARRHDGWV